MGKGLKDEAVTYVYSVGLRAAPAPSRVGVRAGVAGTWMLLSWRNARARERSLHTPTERLATLESLDADRGHVAWLDRKTEADSRRDHGGWSGECVSES